MDILSLKSSTGRIILLLDDFQSHDRDNKSDDMMCTNNTRNASYLLYEGDNEMTVEKGLTNLASA